MHRITYDITPYQAGMGPGFTLVASSRGWAFNLIPADAGPGTLLAAGHEYPTKQGHMMDPSEPQTIGELLSFIIAAHPRSGSGISADNCWAEYGWIGQAALDLVAPHLEAIEWEAQTLLADGTWPENVNQQLTREG